MYLDSLIIFAGNDVISYFRSAAILINVCVHFGPFSSGDFSIMVQPILKKVYSVGNGDSRASFSVATYQTFLLLDPEKWGLKWTYRRLRVT